MIEINLFSRDDKIYKTIESYRSYETTYAACYEMAVRNNEVIQLLEEMEHIRFQAQKIYLSIDENSHDQELTFFSIVVNEDIDTDPELIACKAKFLDLLNYSSSTFYFQLSDGDLFRNRHKYIDFELPHNYYEDLNFHLTKETGHWNIITPFDSRRKPIIPKLKSRVKDIPVDFSLPKDEIAAAILEIKKFYDKQYQIVNSDIEKVLKNKNLYIFKATLKNSNKLDSIEYPKKTKSQMYADFFFIYDRVSANLGIIDDECIQDIQNELLDYYTNFMIKYNKLSKQKIKELEIDIYNSMTRIDSTTIEKRYLMMVNYIDKLQYKELLT